MAISRRTTIAFTVVSCVISAIVVALAGRDATPDERVGVPALASVDRGPPKRVADSWGCTVRTRQDVTRHAFDDRGRLVARTWRADDGTVTSSRWRYEANGTVLYYGGPPDAESLDDVRTSLRSESSASVVDGALVQRTRDYSGGDTREETAQYTLDANRRVVRTVIDAPVTGHQIRTCRFDAAGRPTQVDVEASQWSPFKRIRWSYERGRVATVEHDDAGTARVTSDGRDRVLVGQGELVYEGRRCNEVFFEVCSTVFARLATPETPPRLPQLLPTP